MKEFCKTCKFRFKCVTGNQVEYTDENIEALVQDVVDSMDIGDLMEYVINEMTKFYKENELIFYEEWEQQFDVL